MEAVTNATFNNISVISWRSVFFSVEETGVPGENHPLRVLNNLRVKWYIWSPNRRSLCIYPGLWLALYIEAALTFFFFFLFLYQYYYFWYYFFFIQHSQQIRTQNSVQWSSLPQDSLRKLLHTKLWTELPFSIRQASSHNAFKTKVKCFLKKFSFCLWDL